MKRKKINIALFGESTAGKTVLMNTYFGHEFCENGLSTIGIDSPTTLMKMKDGNEIKVTLFDTAGQERFHLISFGILKASDAAAIFYDVSNRQSFEKIENWYSYIIENAGNIPIILIACKCDIEHREISKEEAEKYAIERNIPYIETSSKNNININEAIEKISNDAYEYVKNKNIENLNINNKTNSNFIKK